MSVFDIFRSQPATPAATPAPPPANVQNPPLPGTQGSAGTDNNGVVPSGTPAPEPSPLDKVSKIWETDPNAAKAGEPQSFALDPTKLAEAAGKIDFTKAITPEILQKIQGGGQDALAALLPAINQAAQQSFQQSLLAANKMTEAAMVRVREQQEAQMPAMFKKFTTGENIVQANPAFNNPAVRPVVEALQTVLIQKNPNASSTEIQQQISDFFGAMGQTFAPAAPAPKNQSGRKQEDWSTFLE